MRLKKNDIILFFFIVILIYSSAIIWNFIKIPYVESDILGEYTTNNHHALNDVFRYVYFVIIPLVGFLLFKIFIEKKKFHLFYLSEISSETYKAKSKLFFINILLIFLLLIEFLSISFPENVIDIFHDGQKLSSAYKSLLDGSLWSGSYITSGIIYENLGPRLFWQFLNHASIGSMRLLDLFYILIFKISLIILIYEIIKKNFFRENLKITYFLSMALVSIFLIDYNLNSGDSFSQRDIPIIIFLIIFFRYLNNFNNIYLPFILLGMLSVVTFYWSVDRALVINALLIFCCIYFFINKKYYNIGLLILSSIFFWYISYIYLGKEFIFFLENTISIFKNHIYVFGIIHPTPFSEMPNSSRATKSLLLIIISILISFNFLLNSNKKYNNQFKVIIITLTAAGFCGYIYALGRSDGGHIKQTIGILVILYSLFALYNLINFFEKVLLNKKVKKKLFLLINSILLITLIYNIKINASNILDYPKRTKDYIYLNDSSFLSNEQNEFIDRLKPLIKNDSCIQLFTNDAALSYLVKKPNCSKYFFIYSLGSVDEQNSMIEEIKETRLVIYKGQTDNWGYLPQIKLPLVNEYIKLNFLEVIKILDWELRIR